MKLFKKLAAAVLVAALALMMVGCGGRNSLLDQVKNVIADFYAMENEELTNKKELDALAAKLMAEGDKAKNLRQTSVSLFHSPHAEDKALFIPAKICHSAAALQKARQGGVLQVYACLLYTS